MSASLSTMPPKQASYSSPFSPADLERLVGAVAAAHSQAWEPSTTRNRASAVRCYTNCCTANRVVPFPVTCQSLGFFAVVFRLVRENKQSSLET